MPHCRRCSRFQSPPPRCCRWCCAGWGAIAALATDLHFGATIAHADVCAALALSDDGGAASMELAMIRSGHA